MGPEGEEGEALTRRASLKEAPQNSAIETNNDIFGLSWFRSG